MTFRRNIFLFTFLLVLLVVLGYFFFQRDQEQPTPETKPEVAAPPTVSADKDPASTAILRSQPGQDRIKTAEYEERESIEELERKASGHSEPEERVGAVLELSQREDGKRSTGTLMSILQNDNEADVREAALDTLEEFQVLSFDLLSKVALNDPEPSLRIRAIEILGEMNQKDRRIIDLLKRIASKDKDEEVRESAKELLTEMAN